MAVPLAGQIIRASDVITYEDAKPRLHAYDGTGLVCVDASVLKLMTWDTELYDTNSMHDPAVNPSRIIFTTAGLYEVDVQVILPSATYTAGLLNTRLNAAGASGGGTSLQNTAFNNAGGSAQPSPRTIIKRAFAAADYLEFWVSQTSGANRTTVAGAYSTRVYATYLASV